MTERQLAIFNKRSYAMYAGARIKARDKTGNKKLELPFELGFFRVQLAAVIEKRIPCIYCQQHITMAEAAFDHKIPPDRAEEFAEMMAIIYPDRLEVCNTPALNKTFEWCNMVVTHKRCNRRKGILTNFEFDGVMELVNEFPPVARKELLTKLSSTPQSFYGSKHKRKPGAAEVAAFNSTAPAQGRLNL